MAVDLAIICVTVLVATALVKRIGGRREMGRQAITPEKLHGLLASNIDVGSVTGNGYGHAQEAHGKPAAAGEPAAGWMRAE